MKLYLKIKNLCLLHGEKLLPSLPLYHITFKKKKEETCSIVDFSDYPGTEKDIDFSRDAAKVSFHFLKSEMCAQNTPTTLYMHLENLNSTHYLINANYSSTIPSGNNININLEVLLLIRDNWVRMFKMDNDKGACDNLNRYARPLFHDLQRRVKMKPGQCPVPPGTYHLENYTFDISKVNFTTFPKGKIRMIAKLFEKLSNALALCYEVILEVL